MNTHLWIRKRCVLVAGFFGALAPLCVSAAAPTFDELASRCAPDVHPATMRALIGHESGFDPLVIGVNGTPHQTVHPTSVSDAVAKTRQFLENGKSIDVGLGQINAKNFSALGLSAETAFDPCKNLAASARILTESYRQFRSTGLEPASALDAALSAYNSGSAGTGMSNGYVASVHERAMPGYVVPSLVDGAATRDTTSAAPEGSAVILEPQHAMAPEPPAEWDVFGDVSSRGSGFITEPKMPTPTPPGSSGAEGLVPKATPDVPDRDPPTPIAKPTGGSVVLFAEPAGKADAHPPPATGGSQ